MKFPTGVLHPTNPPSKSTNFYGVYGWNGEKRTHMQRRRKIATLGSRDDLQTHNMHNLTKITVNTGGHYLDDMVERSG